MRIRKSSLRVPLLAGLALLLALPALAGSPVITNGVDLWRTPANGGTFVDFARSPLPAGFFCASSAPFTGRVVFGGVPIKTKPANALGGADTLIQRLDDAAFTQNAAFRPFKLRGADGSLSQIDPASFRGQEVAVTRLQVKAISFASTRPVSTACGPYTVTAALAGEQPVTEMIIQREREVGGRFYAPLSLNVKLTFTPMRGGAAIEVMRRIDFPAKPLSVWSENPNKAAPYNGFVSVDTDLDGAVDTMLPGTSNFAAGFKEPPARGFHQKLQQQVDQPEPAESYIGVPYCGGTSRYYAEHCHQTIPVAE